VRQNIAFREHLSLWGEAPRRLPDWFTQRFPASYQAMRLFHDALPKGFGLQPLPAADSRVLISVPERAMLERLSDVGKAQSLAEARELAESLSGLREKVLDRLPAARRCTRRRPIVRRRRCAGCAGARAPPRAGSSWWQSRPQDGRP